VAQAHKPALVAQSARRKQKIAHHARSRHARSKAAEAAAVTMVQSTIDVH
jgi:hypothetical protein